MVKSLFFLIKIEFTLPNQQTTKSNKNQPCDSFPCKNGGTCEINSVSNSFLCICQNGFSGLDCSAQTSSIAKKNII